MPKKPKKQRIKKMKNYKIFPHFKKVYLGLKLRKILFKIKTTLVKIVTLIKKTKKINNLNILL